MATQSLPHRGTDENRTVLALDLGTQLGWALHHPDGTITSGTVSFKLGRFEGGGMQWVRFKAWLDEMHFTSDVGQILFEEVRRHIGTTAAHVYGGFLAHLTAWAEHHEVPYMGVPVGSIKKSATGKGNASKEQVIHAMKHLGYAPEDDNEADALALLHWQIDQGGAR
ncbi:conserved hypothetical protein [Magnetococcus marinus MC-1]|uniref:Bacteriophage-related protein n=1 Tax=Magnetococcus marinus (strain ATCC BAA-1437 / JCM 17883 / MC-1) TaxID=156889 RepID=A0LBJ0_MAGMM|nr:hypothetical protein [Magnetococcus marinus]ABK45333.1 conserved hypothetical protein [Magnetococcus marinus MC-1]